MIQDSELLRRYVRDRSNESFASLVQRHVNLVYFAALRRTNGDTHAAKDITQLVFIALAREAASLPPNTVLPGWLYVSTSHAAANAMRSRQRRAAREAEAFAMHDTSDSSLDAEWSRLRPELDSAMDDLNPSDRDAILLRYFENCPFSEIGVNLQVSEDAARVRVGRALDKLREILTKRGITSTATGLAAALATQAAFSAPAGLAASVVGGMASAASLAGGAIAQPASILNLMITNKGIATVTALTVCLAAGVAFHQSRKISRAEQRLAAVSLERDAFGAEIARIKTEMQAVQDRLKTAEARGAIESKIRNAMVISPTTPAPSNHQENMVNSAVQFLENQRLTLSLGLDYKALYRKLNLSRDKIAAFERIKLDEHRDLQVMMAVARTKGYSISDPTLAPLPNDEIKTKLRDLLGEAGYEDYASFRQTMGARQSVTSLAGNLAALDTPLTTPQFRTIGSNRRSQWRPPGQPRPHRDRRTAELERSNRRFPYRAHR